MAVTLNTNGQEVTLSDESLQALAAALPEINPNGPNANKYTFYIWAAVFGTITTLALVSIWVAASSSDKEVRTAFIGFVGLLIGGILGVLVPSPAKPAK